MEIKLAKGFIWMLGTPRGDPDDVISLNNDNPGPIIVDYEGLSRADKKHIILSFRKGDIKSPQVKSTEDIDALATAFMTEHGQAERPVARVEVKPRDPRVVAVEKQQKDEERAEYLSKQTVSVIRSALTGENNTRMLTLLLDAEIAGRHRKSVINAVSAKTAQIHKQVTKHLDQEAEKAPIPMSLVDPTTNLLSVVESEEMDIVLSEEQIKELATLGF